MCHASVIVPTEKNMNQLFFMLAREILNVRICVCVYECVCVCMCVGGVGVCMGVYVNVCVCVCESVFFLFFPYTSSVYMCTYKREDIQGQIFFLFRCPCLNTYLCLCKQV